MYPSNEMTVVIERDDGVRKVVRVTRGEQTRTVVIQREFVDNHHAQWTWSFWPSLSTALYQPPHPLYPSWERALEEALNQVTSRGRESGSE